MKRVITAFAVCSVAAGCSSNSTTTLTDDSDESVAQALGTPFTGGNLTKKSFPSTDTANKDAYYANDTDAYYANLVPLGNGTFGTFADIDKLSKFKGQYGLDGTEAAQAKYYNRGDLGIGRDMHCAKHLTAAGYETACYVSNYAAGADGTEFIFGLSSSIAFANMNANHPFATVAMVSRSNSSLTNNQVFFVVYDASGNSQNFAALDRYGITAVTNPASSLVAGTNYNNHIPTNCMACHGGSYDATSHTGAGGQFLPFDLDQFEYQNVSGLTRDSLDPYFLQLNQLVRDTAPSSNVAKQIDLWYGNTGNPPSATLTGSFQPSAIPSGWAANSDLYLSVIRGKCRTCHITGAYPFNSSSDLTGPNAYAAADDLCKFVMPHSFQVVRQFWQSSAPAKLLSYFQSLGAADGGAAARFANCGPGSVVTLDPPQVHAAAW